MAGNYKYKIYEVKRRIGSEGLTKKFVWFEEGKPTLDDYGKIFQEPTTQTKEPIRTITEKGKPAVIEMWKPAEAPAPWEAPAPTKERKSGRALTVEDVLGPEDVIVYEILKVEDATNLKMLTLIGGISFVSIWGIYGFIRWVILAFVVGGFKDKASPTGG